MYHAVRKPQTMKNLVRDVKMQRKKTPRMFKSKRNKSAATAEDLKEDETNQL